MLQLNRQSPHMLLTDNTSFFMVNLFMIKVCKYNLFPNSTYKVNVNTVQFTSKSKD